MRIAQVPPLFEAVPPKLYGGTERVVGYLTEELVRQGHDVTLFGTRDSQTVARNIIVCEQALRQNKHYGDSLAWQLYQLQTVADHADEFDIIHFHNDYLHFPFSQKSNYVHITTLHGRLDLNDLKPIYKRFKTIPLISISNNQRIPFPDVNWIKTIYHGLPENLYQLGNGGGNYLAFLGRISPEKRPDRAIEIAKRAGIKLKIAAKIDAVDRVYFERTIKPLLDDPLIEYIGEIDENSKKNFLGNAMALLFPIDWPEPFGMVMIESMANGTPVIAFDCGSVPEIIDTQTGFIVRSIEEAVNVINKIPSFDRKRCRDKFLERFTVEIMTKNYINAYQQLLMNDNMIKNISLKPNKPVTVM